MAKKSFKSGLDSLITSTTKSSSNEINNQEKYVTFNFLLKEEYHKKLKMESVLQGRSIKEIVNDMVKEYFDKK